MQKLKKQALQSLLSSKVTLNSVSALGFQTDEYEKEIRELDKDIEGSILYIFPAKYEHIKEQSKLIKAIAEREYLFNLKAQKELLVNRCLEVQSQLYLSDPYTIPSHDSIQGKIDALLASTESAQINIVVLKNEFTEVKSLASQISDEVEMKKRSQLLEQANASENELRELNAFFLERPGYETEKKQLNDFTNKLADINSPKYARMGSTMLSAVIQYSLYPLLDLPRKTRAMIEDEEYRQWAKEQKIKQAQVGIPTAPIGSGKMILVDIALQRLYAYENGVSIFQLPIPVTTGMRGFDTVRGQFAVYDKQTHFRMRSPFPNIYYDNYVTYWMPFYEGYGLHDAPWRLSYGGQDYPVIGSHGCINIPFTEVEQLYFWAQIGTPVIVR